MSASLDAGSALAGLRGPEMNVASNETNVARTRNVFFTELSFDAAKEEGLVSADSP